MRGRWTGRKKALVAGIAGILLSAAIALSVNIREITVTGNERYTDEQMEELLFPDRMSRNFLYCYIRDRFFPHQEIPFVEDYRLSFTGPFRVEVTVYEKSIVGYVSYMSSYLYFDKDGIVVESVSQKLDGIVQITGLKFGQIVLYQKLPVENEAIFDEILNLTQVLSVYGLHVDEIHYDSSGNATLYLGGIEVLLGDGSDINGKISELHDILPVLEGRTGVLHLEDYDEAGNAAGYEFNPR